MNKKTSPQADGWLEQAYPEMHHMLLALEGDEPALEWLKANSKGVSLLVRAMLGKRKALAALHDEQPTSMDDLFELIDNEDLTDWLSQRQPEVAWLFHAIKGGDGSPSSLKPSRPRLARLAAVVRELHDTWQKQRNGGMPIDNGSAADMGCLIGEMHLRAGQYERAVEAFSRAIASQPEPDLYEGRARAYRALAEADERRALDIRRER